MKHPFNWARVLRHELVHIFNLDQTHFLVPHWLTEGLAVNNEGFPRPQQWSELLLQRVPKGELMNLDDIDLGFIRPRSPADWHMAYCQSQLYVNYVQEKFGPPAIGELLQAYGDGLLTEEVIAKVCKLNKAEFEKGYRTYLDGVVRGLKAKPAEKALSFLETRSAYNQDPNNLDLAARLAEFNLKRDPKTARKLADKVLAQRKNHPRASYVMAQLLRAAGEDEKALAMLEAAHDPKDPDPRVLELLGRTYFEAEKFDQAAELYEEARQAEPYDSKWLVELARMYAHTKNNEKLIQTLKELVPTDADELDQRKRLARLLLAAGRPAEAERYAREALEIDVIDAEAEQCLGEALLGQKQWAGAIKTLQLAMALYEKAKAPEKANEARLKLAFAYQGGEQKEKALSEVVQVLARDPENEAAKKLKDALSR
jgi:tetratricopeptide (TPR) repeat protein